MLLLDIDQDSRQRTADRDESETVVDFTSIRRTTSKVCMEGKGKCSVARRQEGDVVVRQCLVPD